MKQTRNNKILTISMTPAAMEAIDLLKEYQIESKTSPVIDSAVKQAVVSLGYHEIKENDMDSVSVEIIYLGKALAESLVKYTHNNVQYFETPEDGNYILRIKNLSYLRKEVVVSVDGLSVMNGEEAGLEIRGYILNGNESIDIKGWRRTDEDVACFNFCKKEESYSSKMGKDIENVGVIGVAVYDEERKYNYWYVNPAPSYPLNPAPSYPWAWPNNFPLPIKYTEPYIQKIRTDESQYDSISEVLCSTNNPHSTLTSTSTKEFSQTRNFFDQPVSGQYDIGTGFGEEVSMKVIRASFNRRNTSPECVMTFRYASRSTLIKWGVIVEELKQPNPFPRNKPACKAPPGWKSKK